MQSEADICETDKISVKTLFNESLADCFFTLNRGFH
jgi:hypothetical protein